MNYWVPIWALVSYQEIPENNTVRHILTMNTLVEIVAIMYGGKHGSLSEFCRRCTNKTASEIELRVRANK